MYIGSFRGQFVLCDSKLKQFTTNDRNKNRKTFYTRSWDSFFYMTDNGHGTLELSSH